MIDSMSDILVQALTIAPVGIIGMLGLGLLSGGSKGSEGPRSGPEKLARAGSVDGGASSEPVNDPVPVGPNQVTKTSPQQSQADTLGIQSAKPPPVTQQLVDDTTESMAKPPEPKPEPTALASLNNDDIAPVKPDIVEKPKSPLDGIASMDAPPATKPLDDVTTAGKDAVAQVATVGDELTPVTQSVAGEELGDVPQARPPDMVADQIGREPPKKLPRIRAKFQTGNPSKQPDMPQQEYAVDQGYAFQGASSPDDMFSPSRYT